MSDRDQDESRRILKQIQGESEVGGLAHRTADRLHDHLTARDADPDDTVEKWGTRIGRAIGALVTVAVIIFVIRALSGTGG